MTADPLANGPRDVPERIVCLTEETTEILYLLGEERRIVGISAYTVRPPRARKEKPVVSAFVDGSVKKIRALEPDLVIGFSDVQAGLAADLIRENLPVLVLQQRTVAEILETVLLIGRLVGAEERALALVDRLQAGLDAAAARTRRQGRRPAVYFEEWDEPMIAGSGWVSELIALAGGRDVFAERAGRKKAMDRTVEAEEVRAAAPEVVLASWCGKPFDGEAFRGRPGFDALPAVRAGRVHEVDAAIILQPGPAALTDGLAALEELLRPPG